MHWLPMALMPLIGVSGALVPNPVENWRARRQRIKTSGPLPRESLAVPQANPCLIEMRVHDGFPGWLPIGIQRNSWPVQMIAESGVQTAIVGLDQARIMVRSSLGAGRIELNMAFPRPAFPFILGYLDCQAMAPRFGIVADQHPVAVPQTDDFGAGSRIRLEAIGHSTPRLTLIHGNTLMQPMRWRTIITHQGKKTSVFAPHNAGLDVSQSSQRQAGMPMETPIVSDRHERKIEPI